MDRISRRCCCCCCCCPQFFSRKITARSRRRRGTLLFPRHLLVPRLLFFLILSEASFFLQNPHAAAADSQYLRECDQLTCKLGEQCVSRKFWCNSPPCPTMTYCSRSRKESLKGPEDCESALCTLGFRCVVRVRDCEWDQKCKQRAARCISERQHEDEPVSCLDFACPRGHGCVLRESHCHRPPCRLTRSCARTADVRVWLEKCKKLGCRSEHECFLRRPPQNCAVSPPCNHLPDCLPAYDFENEDESRYCRGWICPASQECTAQAACKHDDCRVARSCRPPLLRHSSNVSAYFDETIDILSPRMADVDKDELLEERRKLRKYPKPSLAADIRRLLTGETAVSAITESPTLPSYPEYASSTKTKRVTSPVPITRATSSPIGDSPWLTYLKRQAGAEALQYWIEKAKNNEDYEEFLEWLDSVALLLDPATYGQWLREVKQASAAAPEFQSWISPHRASHRLLPDPTSSLRSFLRDSVNQGSAVDGRRKNLFYSDKSLVLVEPNSNSDVDYRQQQRQSFMEKATVLAAPTQKHWPTPSNFNFNDGGGGERDAPAALGFRRSGIQSVLDSAASDAPYPEIANRAGQLSSAQDFGEAVKNSWKSWQSYYQFNPPPTNLPGFSAPAFPARDSSSSFHLNNHSYEPAAMASTNVHHYGGGGGATTARYDGRQQRFFPARGIDWGDAQVKRVKLNDDQYELRKMPSRDVPAGVASMIDQLAALQQFGGSSPNVLSLDPSKPVSQLALPSSEGDNEADLPNLLIYFPPPLNFFIYYSPRNRSGSDVDKAKGVVVQPSQERMFQPKAEERPPEKKCEDEKSKQRFDRQKELELVKRMIKELLNYWDSEEKYLESLRSEEAENAGETRRKQDPDESSVSDAKPAYAAFLEWLTKKGFNGSALLNQKPRKKGPQNAKDGAENRGSPETQKGGASPENKVRILVDIDKNPELLKALFSRNKTNGTDSREYQVIVNLNDFVDPREEDAISRRLIDIAANQLHRNVSGEQKMPKTLWVFPIYDDEDNRTVIDEIEKRNNSNKRVNTLEDVNLPTSQSEIERIQATQAPKDKYSRLIQAAIQKEVDSARRKSQNNDYEDYGDAEDTAKEADEDYDQFGSYESRGQDESEENGGS